MLSKTSTGRQKHPKWIHEYDNWWRKMKKMSNKIGLFGRIQQKLTKTAKKKRYTTTSFQHCSSIIFLANEEDLMQIIQNRAMRLILKCHRRTHVRTLLDNL
jgi:hypothetical protein